MNPSKSRKNRRSKSKKKNNNVSTTNSPSSAPLQHDVAGLANVPDSAPTDVASSFTKEEREKSLEWLAEAFASATVEEVNSAYCEADGDACRAAEILEERSYSRGGWEKGELRGSGGRRKMKKVVTASGLVSDVIGKEYVNGAARGERCNFYERKSVEEGNCGNREEALEFLLEMLGEDCELDPGVIRDAFGNCSYNVEMTLDVLLGMSDSSNKQFHNINYGNYTKNELNYFRDPEESYSNNNTKCWKLFGKTTDLAYQKPEKCNDVLTSPTVGGRVEEKSHIILVEQPGNSIPREKTGVSRFSSPVHEIAKKDLQQRVLESIFNIKDLSHHEPSGMNWKKVVKKLEAVGVGFEFSSAGMTESEEKLSDDRGDSYHVFRSSANKHWDAMRSHYQRAVTAYSKGQRSHATYLSEQGRYFKNLAQEAEQKASRDIFEAKNKKIQNVITIDLHGQHVQQAMDFLKLHVLFLTYSPAIQLLRVITGCGSHGIGVGKLKKSAINFLENEGIQWGEENPGILIIKADRFREYNFVNSENDPEDIKLGAR